MASTIDLESGSQKDLAEVMCENAAKSHETMDLATQRVAFCAHPPLCRALNTGRGAGLGD
jgi:hypothetical protein